MRHGNFREDGACLPRAPNVYFNIVCFMYNTAWGSGLVHLKDKRRVDNHKISKEIDR
jgi:hypothetical protein